MLLQPVSTDPVRQRYRYHADDAPRELFSQTQQPALTDVSPLYRKLLRGLDAALDAFDTAGVAALPFRLAKIGFFTQRRRMSPAFPVASYLARLALPELPPRLTDLPPAFYRAPLTDTVWATARSRAPPLSL